MGESGGKSPTPIHSSHFESHQSPTQAKEGAGIARFVLELQPGGPRAQVCGICREEVPGKELVAIGCGHFFCQPCYTAYLCSKVRMHVCMHVWAGRAAVGCGVWDVGYGMGRDWSIDRSVDGSLWLTPSALTQPHTHK